MIAKDKVFRIFIALFVLSIFILVFLAPIQVLPEARLLSDYYKTYYIRDTASLNAVTGIYLNYRLFDTIFETLTLLVSVIGIVYFSRHEGDT